MSKPTARELLDRAVHTDEQELTDLRQIAARVEKVLAVHQKQTNLSGQAFCWAGCAGWWPCKTARLLNGERE